MKTVLFRVEACEKTSPIFTLCQNPRLSFLPRRYCEFALFYNPIVHIQAVTHYTLRGKACEKGQRCFHLCPFFCRQVKLSFRVQPYRSPFCFLFQAPHPGLCHFFQIQIGMGHGILRGACQGCYVIDLGNSHAL